MTSLQHAAYAQDAREAFALYETMRTGVPTVVVVPASALDSMNLGAVTGLSGLVQAPTPATSPTIAVPPTIVPPAIGPPIQLPEI